MLTINLEKELSKQPVSKVNASELLLIKEYEKLGEDVAESEILSRIGVNNAALSGREIKFNTDSLLKEASRFNTGKVYHISQIEALCKKYRLRFLPSALFKGNIDPCLTDKISTFEVAYGVKCQCVVKERRRWDFEDDIEKSNNIFIAAPASSFALQEKPKDPLLFFKINEEYYYLIHKWGNDLSLFRRLYRFLESKLLLWSIFISAIILLSCNIKIVSGDVSHDVRSIISLVLLFLMVFTLIIMLASYEESFRLIKKNEIKSRYL